AHEPFRPVSLEVSLTEAAPQADLEIVFVDGVTVEGEVRNREGVALPQAILSWKPMGRPSGAALECIADPEGRFERKGLEPGRYRVLVQGAIDLARLQVEVLLEDASPQWIPLAFDILPPLIVHVEDVHGARLAGAPVWCKFRSERVDSSGAPKHTDSRGTVALVGYPAEGHLRITAGDRRLGTGFASLDMATAPSRLVLRLEPWGSIAGKVLEENERPVPGASVIASKGRGDGGRVETAEDGSFELPLPAGEWDLEVTSGPHGKAQRQGVQVEPAERTDLIAIVVSDDSSSIRGRVLDAAGEPIRGASVSIHAPVFRDGEHHATLETDRDGWFAALLPEAQYVVKAGAERFEPMEVAGVRPGGEPLEIRLEPLPERSLSGRVLLDGEPVEGAEVRYFSLRDEGGVSRGPVAVSGPAGMFEFPQLAVASPRFVVTAQGPQFAFARSAELLLPREGRMEGIEVVAQPGTDLEVHVTQPDGLDAAGMSISLKGEGKPPIEAEGRTDAKGIWRLRRLPPGSYQLRVDSPAGDLSARMAIEWQGDPEQKAVEVQLRSNPSHR
ncbi:MAG TPA: carboxypeptidase-like regulatory domain-containing protein, partial [Planctomycetota bacterium]|nr:carboxypeptidase-like regulatory domain-containing protein [Planctomycetota bacterium]